MRFVKIPADLSTAPDLSCVVIRKRHRENSETISIVKTSGESRIIFLPERSSIYQYRPEISAIIVKKQSRTRLLFAHPLLYILKTQKMYCAFRKYPFQNQAKSVIGYVSLTSKVGEAMQLELSKCKTSTISRTSRDYHNTNIDYYLKAFHKGS